MLAAVEATLLGKDERLVAKCNVPGILAVFERWDIYDVDTLSANLASSFAELQRDLAPVAALSFLALLKATIGRVPSATPPDTPSSTPPTTPFHQAPPCFSGHRGHLAAGRRQRRRSAHACRPRAASARRARLAATGCSRAASAPLCTTTRKHAWARRGWPTRPLPSRPRSRGRARHASRRVPPPSSGRCSSRRVSARPAPRSRARSAQRRSDEQLE